MFLSSASRGKAGPALLNTSKCLRRCIVTQDATARKEGDISSVFRSLSAADDETALPARFAGVKRSLLKDDRAVHASWNRLLRRLQEETAIVKSQGTSCIPEIQFSDLDSPPAEFSEALRRRGVAVIKQVVPETEARGYKEEVEAYIHANPSTKAFPANDPQVYEIYWSKQQLAARSHPNMIKAQKFLMSYWKSKNPSTAVSTSQPLTYVDRLRIRQPGDSGFALGPHVDGGSVERWEKTGYGAGQVYDAIFEGRWEDFNPWETDGRLHAKQDLYNGAGACSMFRMYQGWLSMSHTGPKEGTLLVNPLLALSTAYYLLRPFFKPKSTPSPLSGESYTSEYLDPENWTLESEPSSAIQGAFPGHGQELSHAWHPHLDLPHTMVHVPRIAPGDFVAWHCDTIHAVDKVHTGSSDSSVLYIPASPTTMQNLDYARRQKEQFLEGLPPADFPGGVGESGHVGRPGLDVLKEVSSTEGLRAMGFAPFDLSLARGEGEAEVLGYGNRVMGFE